MMSVMLLELLLWGCLLLLFWAMKDGLSQVESEIEDGNGKLAPSRGRPRYAQPQKVQEPIGSYLGEQIYRYAVIDGRTYQFDRVCPPDCPIALRDGERYLAPGLIYLENRPLLSAPAV
jgi:hypothetical protein